MQHCSEQFFFNTSVSSKVWPIFRSSRPELFCKKKACNFIKKKTLTQVFSCEFCQISRNTFFHRTPPAAAFEFSYLKLDKNLKVRPVFFSKATSTVYCYFTCSLFNFFTEKEYNSKVVFSYFTERTNSCKTLGIINWFFSYIISRWNSLDKKIHSMKAKSNNTVLDYSRKPHIWFLTAEAVARRCSVKKMFSQISQNSQ